MAFGKYGAPHQIQAAILLVLGKALSVTTIVLLVLHVLTVLRNTVHETFPYFLIVLKPSKLSEPLAMKTIPHLFQICFLLLASIGIAFAENLTFTGTCDKDPLSYRCGEEMTFSIILVDRDNENKPVPGRTLSWERTGDDGQVERGKGTSDEPLVITTSLSKPGFAHIKVTILDDDGKPVEGVTHTFDGGAGADIERIESYPAPDDFRDFWAGAMKNLHDTPYTVTMTPLEIEEPYNVWKFELTTFDGERPSTGLIGWRTDAGDGPLPATIGVYGYGFGPSGIPKQIMDQKRIFMIITRHGEEPREPQEYYEALKTNEMRGFCFRNNESLYGNDFYKMLMRDQRAMQWMESLPNVNLDDIVANGGSMGGYRSIALAALDHHLASISADIPWCADLSGNPKFGRLGGWRPEFTETLGYFDAANLATLVECPISMCIGLGDYVCPPSTEMILYRNFNCTKKMTVVQNMIHGTWLGVNAAVTNYSNPIPISVDGPMADHLVLPAGRPLVLSGTAAPGLAISACLQSATADDGDSIPVVSCMADENGKWTLSIATPENACGPFTVSLSAPAYRLSWRNIMFK